MLVAATAAVPSRGLAPHASQTPSSRPPNQDGRSFSDIAWGTKRTASNCSNTNLMAPRVAVQ